MNGKLSNWIIPIGLALAGWIMTAVGLYVVLTNRISVVETTIANAELAKLPAQMAAANTKLDILMRTTGR